MTTPDLVFKEVFTVVNEANFSTEVSSKTIIISVLSVCYWRVFCDIKPLICSVHLLSTCMGS